MKKKMLLISVLIFLILAVGTIEVNAWYDYGWGKAKERDDDTASDVAYVGRNLKDASGKPLPVDQNSVQKLYNGNHRFVVDGMVRKGETEYFTISYFGDEYFQAGKYKITCGTAVETGLTLKGKDLASTSIKISERIDGGGFWDDETLGEVHFLVTITPNYTTKDLKGAGLDHLWFRIDIFDQENEDSPWHYVVIVLKNIEISEDQQKAEHEAYFYENVYKGKYKDRGSLEMGIATNDATKVGYFFISDLLENNSQEMAKLRKETLESSLGVIERNRDNPNQQSAVLTDQREKIIEVIKKAIAVLDSAEREEKKLTDEEKQNAINEEISDTVAQMKEADEKRKKELEERIKSYESKILVESRENIQFENVFTNIGYYADNIEDVSEEEAQSLANKVNVILTIITNIGMIAAVLMSAFVGVKYMLSSVEEKADYKQDIIPYLVGAILLFGICGIVKVLYSIGNNINNI